MVCSREYISLCAAHRKAKFKITKLDTLIKAVDTPNGANIIE